MICSILYTFVIIIVAVNFSSLIAVSSQLFLSLPVIFFTFFASSSLLHPTTGKEGGEGCGSTQL